MPVFVHLTQAKSKSNILKNGIKKSEIHFEDTDNGVFCMPVIKDFFATHQWLREIKRFEKKNIIAIYFRVKNHELLSYGLYNNKHLSGSASESTRAFMDLEDKMGFQTIIPRNIKPSEIIKFKELTQMIGWRFYPKAKGRKLCLCPACLGRGEYNSDRIFINRYDTCLSTLRAAKTELEKQNSLKEIYNVLTVNRKRKVKDYEPLLFLMNDESEGVLLELIRVLGCIKSNKIVDILSSFLFHINIYVQAACVEEILSIKGHSGLKYVEHLREIPEIKKIIKEYEELFEEDDILIT